MIYDNVAVEALIINVEGRGIYRSMLKKEDVGHKLGIERIERKITILLSCALHMTVFN
ncbi:hypothetical protein Hanom_Chr01g00052251 [Helianthus anomalus]